MQGRAAGRTSAVFVVQLCLFSTPWTAAHQASCPSLSPGVCSDSCPLSRWCHPTISACCPQEWGQWKGEAGGTRRDQEVHVPVLIQSTFNMWLIPSAVRREASRGYSFFSVQQFILIMALSPSHLLFTSSVLHYLPEFAQIHVPWVSDAI